MFLMLSRVPDEQTRMRVAAKLARVLRPGGIVLWYDFRYPAATRRRGDDRDDARTDRARVPGL